jgi:outer membrane protein TolC
MILKIKQTKYLVFKLILFYFLSGFSNSIVAKTITIGIIVDGTNKKEILPIQQIKQEIITLNQGEFAISFPAEKVINAHWELNNIRAAIATLNADKNVDLIITQGLISSHEAAHFKHLKKPVIAIVIADRKLQNLPYKNGSSDKSNFTYINSSNSVEQDLRQFYQLVPYKHLIIPVDPVFLKALPSLRTIAVHAQQELGFNLTFLPVTDGLEQTLEQIPNNADAIYLPPLMRFSKEDHQAFANGLIEKKLPSFSLLGRMDLEQGFMLTLNGRKMDNLRFSRRIALMVQSILLGTNASQLKVDLENPPKLAINMQTARAIGYSPKWRDKEVAELLFDDAIQESKVLSLTDAITQSVAANLGLLSEKMNIALAEDQVTNSRSALLPQINIGVSGTHIDQNRAGVQQSQRSADAEIKASQLIYSESRWSSFDVARLLKEAEDASFQTRVLDIMSQSATTYLQVLSARATEKVRLANLKVSETNLELAQMRLKIGYSDRSDALRWKSVIATDRSALYIAQASREQQETELKRLLHIPLHELVSVTDKGISRQIGMLNQEKFSGFFDNELNFNHFVNFEVKRALDNAPELKQVNHLFQSVRRQLDAGKRAYYIPDVSVNAQFGQNIAQGGIGSRNNQFQKDDWSVGFQASLPLFTSGARSAEVSRASNTLIQTQYQRENIQESIEARVRAALQKTKGSFPSIRLSQDAAIAAKENFEMVSDSYARGMISITSLIDAQNAALSADLSAVNTLYTFMIDWVEIQRSVGNFEMLLSEQGIDNWYQELDIWYQTKR